MKTPTLNPFQTRTNPPRADSADGQLRDGVATIDQLLAEMNPNDHRLFDAVLDLRLHCAAMADAESCVKHLFNVSDLLCDRHYEAFFRIRCWAARAFWIQVRADRAAPWVGHAFPLSSGDIADAIEAAIAMLPASNRPTASVRFVFAAQPSPSDDDDW